ncbi:MAG: secretin N-terminal domain-containing protein, partial [Pseudomonadota bacterium]
QQVVEIIPVKYAEAKSLAQMVLNLFEAGAAGGRKKTGQEDLQDVSKIIADDRTNSLIVIASKRGIPKVREIIAKLDRAAPGGGQLHVHYLKYADAKTMAATISSITSKGGGGGAKDKAGAVAQLEGGVSLGADETTNALVITASEKDYQILVNELINKLDIPRRQVFLESVVMEIALQSGGKYGMSGHGGLARGPMLGFGGMGFSGLSALSGLFAPQSFFATQGLLGGLLGRDNVTIDTPNASGGTTTTTIPSFSAFLNLLQSNTESNVVSTPNLLTLDNEEAEISVTSKIYAQSTSVTSTGVQTTSPTPLEAGLTLKITPQINEGDTVRLKIDHEQSNFTAPADKLTGAAPSTKRKITTTVIAQDGQTVVLGGLMQDINTKGKSKVPLLGDIPVLGLLFQYTETQKSKSNLLVFITPNILKDPSDFVEIFKRKVGQRNKFIEDNFGKRRRKQIAEVIRNHREDLVQGLGEDNKKKTKAIPLTPKGN